MSKIKQIVAREILDSRGNPTLETKVTLESGLTAKASVPSGASTGQHEAWELRDGDESRYHGKGVFKAVKNVNSTINAKLTGQEANNQEVIDNEMIKLDGTNNKRKLGANAILSVSLAVARSAALDNGQELYVYLAQAFKFRLGKKPALPTPSFNIFNGGKHADTNLDFQEFMIMPLRSDFPRRGSPRRGSGQAPRSDSGQAPRSDSGQAPRSDSGQALRQDTGQAPKGRKKNTDKKSNDQEMELPFARKVRMGAEIFHELGHVLKSSGFDTDVGNEGGYAPDIHSSVEAIELIIAAIINAGYEPGKDIGIGIDVGSSELYNKETGKYIFKLDNAQFASRDLAGLYYEWFRKFPIISIEDGLAEDDWDGWRRLNEELGGEMLLIGDDLFVTNIKRLRQGLKVRAANAILIKPNQVGTLTETVACVKLAQKHNLKIMTSHRSGETCDTFIADLAVAIGSDYIKSGSLSRSERLAKYNRLMEIEQIINQ